MNTNTNSHGLTTFEMVSPKELVDQRAYYAQLQILRKWCQSHIGTHVHLVTQQVDDLCIPDGKRIHGKISDVDILGDGKELLVLENVIICNEGISPRKRMRSKPDLRCIQRLEFNPNWCEPGKDPVRGQTRCGCD